MMYSKHPINRASSYLVSNLPCLQMSPQIASFMWNQMQITIRFTVQLDVVPRTFVPPPRKKHGKSRGYFVL